MKTNIYEQVRNGNTSTYIEYWQIENGNETVVGHENYTKTEVWDMSADNRPTGRKLQQVLTGRIRKVVY